MIRGRVSVVVASYNHAEFLAKRMDSLLAQTYPDLEILVVDDCSSDDSLPVLRRYQSCSNVNVVVREKNGGWVATFNHGQSLATGEFVIFANCDDVCEPRLIERLVAALRACPTAGMAFCRSRFIDEQDRICGEDVATQESAFRRRCALDTLLSGSEMGRFLLRSCVLPNMSAVLIRQECFATLGPFSPAFPVIGDWEFFFRVAAQYDVAYVAEPLNGFRQHATTIRSSTKGRVTCAECIRLLLSQIRRLDLSPRERCRYRTHVMYVWAVHVISPSSAGLRNVPYHLGLVLTHDPAALAFAVPGIVRRSVEVFGKAIFGRSRLGNAT